MGTYIITDADFPDGPIDYRDVFIDQYTKYLVDAGDPGSWPGIAPTVGARWKDLSPEGNDIEIAGTVAPVWADNEFVISTDNGIKMILPTVAKIGPSCKGFIATTWLRPKNSGNTSPSTRRVIGWIKNPLSGPWGIYVTSGNQYTLAADGGTYAITLPDDEVVQLAFGRVADGAGGFRRVFAVNGVVVKSEASGASVPQPAAPAPADATIGVDISGIGFGGPPNSGWQGSIMRHGLSIVGDSVAAYTFDDFVRIIETDYALNDGRWGS